MQPLALHFCATVMAMMMITFVSRNRIKLSPWCSTNEQTSFTLNIWINHHQKQLWHSCKRFINHKSIINWKKHQAFFSYFILRNPLHLLEWFPPSSSIHNFENFPHKSHLHDDRDKMPVTWVFPELLVCKVITAPSRLSFDIIIIILGISKHTLLLYFRLCSHPL